MRTAPCARLAAAGALSLLLMSGCSAGGPRYHDKQPASHSARGVSIAESSGRMTPYYWAQASGQVAANRHGYLSPLLAKDLRVVILGSLYAGRRALQAFAHDCRAAGVSGQVYLPSAISPG